jgi:hypothetical protein
MEKSGMEESRSSRGESAPIVFATYASGEQHLQHVFHLAESIRTFAGCCRDVPLWIYMPGDLLNTITDLIGTLESLGVEPRISDPPRKAKQFHYAGKVYAAGSAEMAAAGRIGILVWLDDDTIFLDEPRAFRLADDISLACRPVMHNRSGSAWERPPDPFWKRIYDKLSIDDRDLFPMTTPADQVKIRAYFNAGILVVRPDRGILRTWVRDFQILCSDPVLADMCERDIEKNIFIHQTALVGAVINVLRRGEIMELSDRYNYPVFFHLKYDSMREFNSIEDVITLRYGDYFRNPDPDWHKDLLGPKDRIHWLKKRLGKTS